MKTQVNKLVSEVNYLIDLGQKLVEYGKNTNDTTEPEVIRQFTFWTTKTGELISRLYEDDNQYHMSFNFFRKTLRMDLLHSGSYTLLFEILGVLDAIKHDLENGMLDDIEKLLQADIFSEFMEMALHLLRSGYKDAAAVIIGSVLENALKKLALLNNISVKALNGKELSIEPINVELCKSNIYNQLVKKQITSWAELRNNAAHGKYDQYDDNNVDQMIQFVKSFTTEYYR